MFEARLDQEEVVLFRCCRQRVFDVEEHEMDHQDLFSEATDQVDHRETRAVKQDQEDRENLEVDQEEDFPHNQHPLQL